MRIDGIVYQDYEAWLVEIGLPPREAAPEVVGDREWKRIGRPREHEHGETIQLLHRQGVRHADIAKTLGISRIKVWQATLTREQRDARCQRVMADAIQRKIWCIVAKGERCIVCGAGYNGENGSIFCFDHRDPNTKHPKLYQTKKKKPAAAKLYTHLSFEEMVAELEKVDLKCHNCHKYDHSAKY